MSKNESMAAIQCGKCNAILPLLTQYPVKGVQTFGYRCSRDGRVHLQLQRNPRTGETIAKQIQLTGSSDEFRPDAISPRSKVNIPVAYTLGSTPVTQQREAAARGSGNPMLKMPTPAYTLGQGGQVHSDQSMHPNQIRKRIQPNRW